MGEHRHGAGCAASEALPTHRSTPPEFDRRRDFFAVSANRRELLDFLVDRGQAYSTRPDRHSTRLDRPGGAPRSILDASLSTVDASSSTHDASWTTGGRAPIDTRRAPIDPRRGDEYRATDNKCAVCGIERPPDRTSRSPGPRRVRSKWRRVGSRSRRVLGWWGARVIEVVSSVGGGGR